MPVWTELEAVQSRQAVLDVRGLPKNLACEMLDRAVGSA